MSSLVDKVRAGYPAGLSDTVRAVLGRPAVRLEDRARAHAAAWARRSADGRAAHGSRGARA